MTTYTIFSKSIICPFWDAKISLSAKYRYNSEPKPHYSFMYSYCPILENNRVPYHKQNKKLSPYNNCISCHCESLDSFPKVESID